MRTPEKLGCQQAFWRSPYHLQSRMALDQVFFRLQVSNRLGNGLKQIPGEHANLAAASGGKIPRQAMQIGSRAGGFPGRKPLSQESEEHTSELQSLTNLVCRLLLEKKKDPSPPSSPANRYRISPGCHAPWPSPSTRRHAPPTPARTRRATPPFHSRTACRRAHVRAT